jgi:glutathione S-transferase
MSNKLTLHELTGSPNNVKVRIALAYKGLEYERKPLETNDYPGDRSSVIAISRQPRLPVLKHGETVLFGSEAIFRYLEANFPHTPPIFSEDFQAFGEIEGWELFARTQLGEPVGMFFGEVFAPQANPDVIAKGNQLLNERTGALEDKLSTGEFLVGDYLTAADISCASLLYLGDMTDAQAQSNPMAGFFHKNFKLGEGREKTRAWVRRVMSYDPVNSRG